MNSYLYSVFQRELVMSLFTSLITRSRTLVCTRGPFLQRSVPSVFVNSFGSATGSLPDSSTDKRWGVGGPDSVRPGIRRKNHMKRMRNRFRVTNKQNKITKMQKQAAAERRLAKIRAKQQFLKDIGMTAKEFL